MHFETLAAASNESALSLFNPVWIGDDPRRPGAAHKDKPDAE